MIIDMYGTEIKFLITQLLEKKVISFVRCYFKLDDTKIHLEYGEGVSRPRNH